MNLNLKVLRDVAESAQRATDGEWGIECGDYPGHLIYPDEGTFCECFGETDVINAVAVHIESASPAVVLHLLDRLERAEQKLAERDTVYPSLMTQVGKEKKT
jgi:hypothetical protein